MAILEIDGKTIEVDVREEIEQFDWYNARWSDEKLIACSPFRDDNSPSFWINFEGEYAGMFGDSGYEDEYYGSGYLPKLLAYLNDYSYEEACDYLLNKYSPIKDDGTIELIAHPRLTRSSNRDIILENYLYDKPLDETYMKSRGINPLITQMHRIFNNDESVGIPWRNFNGDVCAIKYRSKKDKVFWYEADGTPLSRLLFSLSEYRRFKSDTVIICEAEIDAMTWQSAGHFAVAVGGARFNEFQRDMLLITGVRKVVLAGDNDRKGQDFNRQVYDLLKGYVDMSVVNYSLFNGDKDANDLGVERLKEINFVDIKKEIRL